MRTVGSLVQELTGVHLNGDSLNRIMRWPPDVFAIVAAILADSGAYRLIVSPPEGCHWPTDAESWVCDVEEAAEAWMEWCAAQESTPPTAAACPVTERIAILETIRDVPLEDLPNTPWEHLDALFTLHAIADESCANLGLGKELEEEQVLYILKANKLLTDTGSLSNFHHSRVRVLPKMRTPQSGISARSLSLYAGFIRCEVATRWLRCEFSPQSGRSDRIAMLLFPWPFEVDRAAFIPVPNPLRNMDISKFGFFDFCPKYDPEELYETFEKTLKGAASVHGAVDAVVLPECSVSESEFARLWEICISNKVKFLLAGVRGAASNEARLRVGTETAGDLIQHKHHRWCLNESQITTYGIGASLNPALNWWERMALRQRELTFVALNDWMTLCHLICEDLARIDPVSQVIRAVGPTLLIALLLDGPQLTGRWPARYSSVFADDPGTSVLTVTAAGMARASCPPGRSPNSTIAYWKDAKFGGVEIVLDPESTGILLTLWSESIQEFAADGRHDSGAASRLIFGGVHQIG